ncbi:MAG: alpha/beta hydrolase [Oscillospiraceae bacterium]|nr:alpha/beta hydrolase [Oscillospiraceae bacterium]
MIIHEFGEEHERHLLFFQGSCEPWEEFSRAARLLGEQFHVMQVTPDGHDPAEGTDFISVEKTVDDAVAWLHDRGIRRLDAVYGLSFGGGMAIHMLASGKMTADRAIIDAGTAPYTYPRWICRLIGVRDYLMLKLARSSVRLMELSFPPERFARDPENAREEYEAIRRYLKTYSDRTIWNIFWSANNYAVPKTAPALSTRIQFWVGTDEWGSRFRDLKWAMRYLPQIELVRIPGMMHGEYVMMHPEAFARQALAFFTGADRR